MPRWSSLVVLGLLIAGCLTHLPPPPKHRQMLVHWQDDYFAGELEARAAHKPMLLVLAAGELDGAC